MQRSLLLAPALAILLSGCGADQRETVPSDLQVDLPAEGATDVSPAPTGTTLAQDQESYRLTMPTVQRWHQAMRNVGETLERNPDLIDEFEDTNNRASVQGLTDHYSSMPQIRAAIERAGIDVREFTLVLVTLPHAMSAQQSIDDGASGEEVIRSRRVNPENLDFVSENRAELTRMQRELEAAG